MELKCDRKNSEVMIDEQEKVVMKPQLLVATVLFYWNRSIYLHNERQFKIKAILINWMSKTKPSTPFQTSTFTCISFGVCIVLCVCSFFHFCRMAANACTLIYRARLHLHSWAILLGAFSFLLHYTIFCCGCCSVEIIIQTVERSWRSKKDIQS